MNIIDFINSLDPFVRLLVYGSVIMFVVLGLFTVRLLFILNKLMIRDGYEYLLFKLKYVASFLGMLVVSVIIVLLLKSGLSGGGGTFAFLMFGAFPYVTLLVFLIGSIYRYRKSGFQVSSLSSQFLEGRKLFWGSQPFHWGILVLFFGHLIAFLFPRSLLLWNSQPVRLLILEGMAFAFGLLTLWGLIMLIRRRLSTRRILVVSNKMDMLGYIVLLVQIVSGLAVAFFLRWGSSWFASVLTPYLKSVFLFNPDIKAVSALPWLIQIHIISAFFIIAIIPFTRFMHFLVVPLDYIWRSYQLVIWNWNHKRIRNSRTYFPGIKSRNN